MKRKALEIIWYALFVLAFLAGIHYLKENSPNAKDAKLDEIQQISKQLSIHPNFIKVGENTSSRHVDAGLYQSFNSKADFETVKAFYISELTHKGWIQIKDKDRLVFRKYDVSLFIDYSPTLSDGNYGLSYVWRNNQ